MCVHEDIAVCRSSSTQLRPSRLGSFDSCVKDLILKRGGSSEHTTEAKQAATLPSLWRGDNKPQKFIRMSFIASVCPLPVCKSQKFPPPDRFAAVVVGHTFRDCLHTTMSIHRFSPPFPCTLLRDVTLPSPGDGLKSGGGGGRGGCCCCLRRRRRSFVRRSGFC